MNVSGQLDIEKSLSALPPSQSELAAWNALTRDEQIEQYRRAFVGTDFQRLTDETPEQILDAARAKVAGCGG